MTILTRAYILVNGVMQSIHYNFCFYCLMQRPGQSSKVQRAILCIFERMEELKKDGRTFGKPGCSARVLVRINQFCCLIGLGGAVIKEMVMSTGAGIEILDETDVPACADAHCERVLQASIFLQQKSHHKLYDLYAFL